MDQEGTINFRALRAKFQEEAALSQAKNRPVVAEKPKRLPPPVGHCSFLVSSIHSAAENKAPVVPKVIFRDGTRASVGKRPISFPPHLLHSYPAEQNVGEGSTTMQSLRDRHMPLVLPVLSKEPKPDMEDPKEVPLLIKCKKKAMPLPFKSTKVLHIGEISKDQVCANPTTKPLWKENQKTEDGVSLQGNHSTTKRQCPSPDKHITPTFADLGGDFSSRAGGTQFSDQRVLGTSEKNKKRFSPRQLLMYARPKSLRSNGVFPPESNSVENGEHPEAELLIPQPVCPPHLACVAARPFLKSRHGTTVGRQSFRDPVDVLPVMSVEPPHQPPRKPLPDLAYLRLPVKPPRPPRVDLSCYQLTSTIGKDFAPVVEHVPFSKPESRQSSITDPELHTPEFPDFENSEMETAEGSTFDIAALELGSRDFGNNIPPPLYFGVTDFEELLVCEPLELGCLDLRALNLNNYNLVLPEPPDLYDTQVLPETLVLPDPPVPEFWVKNEAFPAPVPEPQTVEAELVSEERFVTESSDHSSELAWNGQARPKPNVCEEENYYDCCNVYEDVETINKFIIGQNSRKHKSVPKNPYADPHPAKEETRQSIRCRNPCKERQSPEIHDDKEQKKREKQRLEKERKEQREKEKKDNEMKKKFKVTGQEEPLYHAKVMVASKVRKNDLAVKSGDAVSIIRTTNCPKGKWLARDSNHKYGYISLMNVELNIKEMLELGKKASQAANRGAPDGDTISMESRSSNYHPMHTSSFTDDDEWTCEDETLSPSTENRLHNRTISLPEMHCAQHSLSDPSLEDLHTQTRHEALQKLAIFFQHKKDGFKDSGENEEHIPTNENPSFLCGVEEPPSMDEEVNFVMDVELLPPPELYADAV